MAPFLLLFLVALPGLEMVIGTIYLAEECSLVRCFQCQVMLIINNKCSKRHKSKDAPGGPVLSHVLLSEEQKCPKFLCHGISPMQFLLILQLQNTLQLPLYLSINYELACYYLVHSGMKFHNQWQAPLQILTFLSF